MIDEKGRSCYEHTINSPYRPLQRERKCSKLKFYVTVKDGFLFNDT